MKVWGAIATDLVRRGGAVLISIRDARGSTPRAAGTHMVVFADGTYTGTIGGGTLEWHAIAEAQRLMSRINNIPQVDVIDLTTGFSSRSYALGPELGQCCGGRVSLGFEVIDQAALAGVQRLAEAEADGQFLAAARIGPKTLSRRIVSSPDQVLDGSALEVFGDAPRTLMLFGAGHVGRALVLALNALPFRVIWVDTRADAFPSVVPANVTPVCPADPVAVLADAPTGSFVLIMTHSHELDLALCDAALRISRFPHVGVIGSATKRARFERRLIAAGVERASVDRLICPIGALGPKSKLPAVIAAVTTVELLVADENCLKVRDGASMDAVLDTIAFEAAVSGSAGWGQSSGS